MAEATAAAWLFVPLAPKEKELVLQGVIFTPQVIRYPSEMAGIAFPRSELDKIKTIYKIQKEMKEEQTDVGGIILLMERGEEVSQPTEPVAETTAAPVVPPKKLVTFNALHTESIGGAGWLEPMFAKIAEEIGAEFIIHCAHGNLERIPPVSVNPDKIDICFWSAPPIGANTQASKFCDNNIPKIWGINLPAGSDDASTPQPDIDIYGGADISDGVVIIGQAIGTSVYILNDLCHYGKDEDSSKECIMIMEKMVTDIKSLFQTDEKRKWMIEEFSKKKANESRMKFVAALKKRASAQIASLKSNYDENINYILQHSNEVEKYVARNLDVSRQMRALEFDDGGLTEKYELEYEKLMQYPPVSSITESSDSLIIETHTLYTTPLKDDGTVRFLGRYRISIPFNTGGTIRATNLDGKVVNLDHPHALNSKGELCWGNMSAPIKKLKETYEFSVLIQVIIDFLQNVNLEDVYGVRVKKWPVVDPETKEIIRKGDE